MDEKDRHILNHLSLFVSDHKKELFDKVLALRTRHVTVVLEDIFQSQNASAVLRTCECLGVQDVHIIEQISRYEINPRVLKGANKWMTLHRYRGDAGNNTEECFTSLRQAGYRILAADPDETGTPVTDVDILAGKVALVFGNELRGLSSWAKANADDLVRVPMYGFTESLNISVSVALSLHPLISGVHKAGPSFFLSETEKDVLKLSWYRRIVRRSDLIEREFLKTIL